MTQTQKLVSTGSKFDYDLIRDEAEKPRAQRRKIIKTRNGSQAPKRYHLGAIKVKELLELFTTTGSFPNPYQTGNIYYAFIQSLINLGINQKHSLPQVKREIKAILETFAPSKKSERQNAWEDFEQKSPKDKMVAMDVNGKIIETGRILQRISGFHPYGEKLRQLHSCVHSYLGQNNLPEYELCTHFNSYQDVEPVSFSHKDRTREKKSDEPAAL